MTSTLSIIGVALAVCAFCGMHTVKAIINANESKRKVEEREKLNKEITAAVGAGLIARACELRRRLRELGD